MRRHVISMLLIALTTGMIAAGEHPWQGKRIYYVTHYLGQLQEKGYFVRHAGSYRKQPCIITEEEKFVFANANAQTPVQAVKIRTLTTTTGEALQRHEAVELGQPGQETISIVDGEARIESSGSFGAPAVIPVPPELLFEVTGEWLAKRTLRKGRSYTANVLDRLSRSVVQIKVDILDRVSKGNWDVPDLWLADLTVEGRPTYQARFTADGRLLRLDAVGMIYQVVGREDYELGRLPLQEMPERLGDAADFPNDFPESHGPGPDTRSPAGPPVPAIHPPGDVSIPIGETVPAWDTFAWLTLQAEPAHEWTNGMISSEYSQIEFSGVSTVITAMRNAPRVDADAIFPMAAPAELQPFLTTSDFIPSVHPSVIDAAYAAVYDNETRREETNIIRAISYVAGWINQTIETEEWRGYAGSALDALIRRSGDALSQARLFAAMARTLGVPTRICQGFLTHTGRAVLHFWAEAWVNGSWIPVDTTVSRVGLPAGYILAERSGGDGSLTFDFAGFLRNPQLRLRLLSAGRDTPGQGTAELIAGDRRSYAYSEGDWMANLYWGFALRLPKSWKGQVKLNSVEMASPDRQASVKCEALPGEYRAGKEELQSNIASLRGNLTRFRLIDDRVVSFDPDGATPALFMDFTCVQDNVNLRCRQYVVPRRQRAFRISFWAPADKFTRYVSDFDSIVASLEF